MSNNDKGLLRNASGELCHVGFGNFLHRERIVAVLESGSLPMKRLRESASKAGLLIDATAGRKMRSLIITDSKHVVLSSLSPQLIRERLDTSPKYSQAGLELSEGEFIS